MPDLAKVESIAAKLDDSAGAEPALENATAPPDGASGAGSAPADAPGGAGAAEAGATAPAGATIDHAALQRKLADQRAKLEERARRKQIRADEEAAKKAREEADAEKAKWSGIGKEKSFLDTLKAMGKDPLEAFEEMKSEALKAGTPEAKLEAMGRVWEAKHEALAKELKDERDARAAEKQAAAEERQRAEAEAAARSFVSDFRKATEDPKYESLTEEYPPEQLYPFVARMRDDPRGFHAAAKHHAIALTFDDGRYNMTDILNVLKAQQSAHFARIEEQRRKRAAPQTAPAGGRSPAEATRQTVNGTVVRNAGTSIGNNVASERAADGVTHKGETREQRVARLAQKFG